MPSVGTQHPASSIALKLNPYPELDLRVLAIQRTTAGRWWNFAHVISPFSRLWLVLGGRAVVRHHDREFVLLPGRIYLIPPFTVHDCACSRRLDHYHLHFVTRMPTGIDLFSLLDCDYQLPASRETLALFRRLETLYPERKLPCFDPAREEYKQFSPPAEAASTTALDDFEASGIMRLLLTPFLRSARDHQGLHARVNRQFLAVEEFIHAHLRQKIELADLARVVELHPTYFSDQFKRTVGIRPLEYLMQRRMERAQYLLLTSHASVKEIAHAVGLPDPAYFSRVFTRLYRVPPSAYRTHHQ